MIQSRSSGHAKAYFSDALSKSDYYISDQELPGFWQGRLAGRLGLEGATTKEAFFALCDNREPESGQPLTPRTVEDRTTGYDINFHCPKSVSVVHALSGDGHILNAFRDSVTETMQLLEADAKTRVRIGGQHKDRETEELVWAQFVHQTARPVEGMLPDPHLHSHCFVFNATWDETEGRIKAGQFRDIKRDMPYYQAHFQKTLSDKLIDLGYGIRKTVKSFEVEGVPQNVIELFSKRTDEIGRIAKEKGITNAKELDELGSRTRAKKQKAANMHELKKEWVGQIEALAPDGSDNNRLVRYAASRSLSLTPEQCVEHSVAHTFERMSVAPERKLLAEAYKHSIGASSATIAGIDETFHADNRFLRVTEGNRELCTTREILREEEYMVDLAKKGQGKIMPLYDTAPELSLHGQQAAAVEHVLTTSHRVSIVRGAAGTGKTTLMKEAVEKMEAAGKQVFVVAPSSDASRGVLKEKEGFQNAETVALLLLDPKRQEALKGQILWVDEAGMLGTKQMTRLLEVVTQQDAQLILGGDTRQHASVERGDALRIINTVAHIPTAEVSKIYRQRNGEYRAAVYDLSKGEVAAGFAKLDQLGFVKSLDPLNPAQALSDGYVDCLRNGKSALVICPTHEQAEVVNTAIRDKMSSENLLGTKEYACEKLVNLNYTEAQKADLRNFREGDFVQFDQNIPGIKRGSLWEIKTTGKGAVLIDKDGETKSIPTERSHDFTVYRSQALDLAVNDKIRITKNGFDAEGKRLNNGTVLEVSKISKKAIFLRPQKGSTGNEYLIPRDFGHLAHAHCITSYASQGKSVEEVFIYQPAATFPATDAKQFYVSVSRGHEKAHIYTDDKEELLQNASQLNERKSAIELIKSLDRQRHFVMEFERAQQHQVQQKQERDYEPDKEL